MKKLNIIIILISGLVIFGCNSSKKDKQLTEQEKMAYNIASMEEDLFDDIEPDKDKAMNMIDSYLEYVEKFPEDTLSPEYLFKASEIAMNFEQPHNSVRYLQQIENNYPEYEKYPTCIFMIGHVYDYYIGDLAKAKKYYTKYIDNYPDHTFVKDAKGALTFMGMTDDQLIDLFEDINKYN